jgi:hypothetical protein
VADNTAPRTAAAASDLANLVDAMLRRRSLDGPIVHKDGFVLLIPGNKGLQMMRRANGASRGRLDGDIDRLLAKLIAAGTLPEAYESALPEDSAEYAQGLAEVREDVVKSLRFQVEEQMVKRKHYLRSLERAEGSNNANSDRKKAARCLANISDLLRTLCTWEVYGTDRDPAWEPTEATIKAAANGNFPWGDEVQGDGAGEPVQRHFGVRYHTAKAQVDRAEEESKYLRMEVVRVFNGLRGRIAVVDKHVEDVKELMEVVGGAAAESSAAAREARVLAGRIKLAKVERERLQIIQEEAVAKLNVYLAAAE